MNEHLPILQVIVPMFGALIATVFLRHARKVALTVSCANTIISFYAVKLVPASYSLGNWLAPIGIEYKLEFYNQKLIVYLNLVFLFFITFFTKHNKNLFYPILLLSLTGLLGILSTNDLFNLYVFIEILSLSSCGLISESKNKKSTFGALEYLIWTSIGATLILIGVGMIFSLTGTLNVEDLRCRLTNLYSNKLVILGLIFFIVGCLVKIALFPMHVWLIQAYKFTSSEVLIYFGATSSLITFYIIYKFTFFVVDLGSLCSKYYFDFFMRGMGLVSIIFGNISACLKRNPRIIILYSSIAQAGYLCLILSNMNKNLLLSYLISDSLTKIGLFIGLDKFENNVTYKRYKKVLFNTLFSISLLSLLGMPLTFSFANKMLLIQSLALGKEYLSFLVVIFGTFLAFHYSYECLRVVVINNNKTENEPNKMYIVSLFIVSAANICAVGFM